MVRLLAFELISLETVRNLFEQANSMGIGYVLLFGLLFACGLGLPLPEDIPLIISGAMVAQGKMHLALAGFLAWCGIIGGDVLLYRFGRRYGLNITRVPFVGRHVTEERIQQAQRLFERYGIWVVAIGRMFAGIRGAMVVAAGTIRYNFIKFIIADSLAAVVSGGMFMAVGYYLGSKLDVIIPKIKHWENAILWILLLAVAAIILWVWWRKRRRAPVVDLALQKAEAVASRHPAAKQAEK